MWSFPESGKPWGRLGGGIGNLPLESLPKWGVMFYSVTSSPCSEETELTPPGQAAFMGPHVD